MFNNGLYGCYFGFRAVILHTFTLGVGGSKILMGLDVAN